MSDGEGSTELDSSLSLKTAASPSEGRKLNEHAKRKPQEYLILFSKVANEVLKVNPAIHAPFSLEEGKQSNLGIFAQAAYPDLGPAKRNNLHQKGQKFGEYSRDHDRSTIIARVLFKDDEGRLYRDVDLKGVGWFGWDIYQGLNVKRPGLNPKSGYVDVWGLENLDEAMADYENSERFLKAGIRTSRVIAIIKLREIIINGERKSIEDLKKHGIDADRTIRDDFVPVVEVRGFATRARFSSLPGSKEPGDLLIKDAKKLIAQELGLKKPFTDRQYIDWLIDTLGYSVGLMHKNGWVHSNLSRQNITLDGRIVDLPTVEVSSKTEKRVEDVKQVTDCLQLSMDEIFSIGLHRMYSSTIKERREIRKRFMRSYYEAFSEGREIGIEEQLKTILAERATPVVW